MAKKLPSVFVNKQQKKIKNNKETFYSREIENETILKKNKNTQKYLDELMVNKKIRDIFDSPKFVYKMKVLILTEEGERKETIIAKIENDLITLNNKKINIHNIKDIKLTS